MSIRLSFVLIRVSKKGGEKNEYLINSFNYYRRYRHNAHETTLSRVVWILIFGVVLFCFPWLAEEMPIYQEMQMIANQN